MLRPHLCQREAAHIHEQKPPRQRLGDALDHVPRGTAEQQKDGLPIRIVARRAQYLEQEREALHLIDDDQTLAVAQ